MKATKLSDLKDQLRRLTYYTSDPRVTKLIDQVAEEREPEIKRVKAEIEKLKSKQRGPKPRWPEDTPQHIIDRCMAYWRGTEEFRTFRIHCWNDKAVWTSYPSGGYSNNGGWNPTPARFYLIPLDGEEHFTRAKKLMELEGRQSSKKLKSLLPK